tara:strand:+ start:1608 stop:1922 length:315 start_codon:yes stop_codon:yes gene_type:complete
MEERRTIKMFVDNLRLDVIATYVNHEQDHFNCGVWESAIKSEKKLIDYIKEQLRHKDLVKLSLCWECPKEVVDKYKTIQDSIKKNAKYYFENGKEIKENGKNNN